MDGSLLSLAFKPSLFGEDYYTRKGSYAVHVLIICDDQACLREYPTGWLGSVHDNRVWKNSWLYNWKEGIFTVFQYLLTNSAFSTSEHVVPAFKKFACVSTLSWEHENFNL